MKIPTFVLDACAILAVANEEQGSETITHLWSKAIENEIKLSIHRINLLEVYYTIIKQNKRKKAEILLQIILESPIIVIDELQRIFLTAAELKSRFKISLADAVAVSTTMLFDGKLITSDHKELEPLEEAGFDHFLWFR